MAQYVTLEEAARRLGLPHGRIQAAAEDRVDARRADARRVRPSGSAPTRSTNSPANSGRPATPGCRSPGSTTSPLNSGRTTSRCPRPRPEVAQARPARGRATPIRWLRRRHLLPVGDAPKPAPSGPGSRPPTATCGLPGENRVAARRKFPVVPTEEIALDVSGPGSAVIKGGSSAKLSAPKSSGKFTKSDSGKKLSSDSGKNPGTRDSGTAASSN